MYTIGECLAIMMGEVDFIIGSTSSSNIRNKGPAAAGVYADAALGCKYVSLSLADFILPTPSCEF